MKDSRWGRSHFDFIAEVISKLPAWGSAATAFADALEGTNKTFVRERFLEACVPKRKVGKGWQQVAQSGIDLYEGVARKLTLPAPTFPVAPRPGDD